MALDPDIAAAIAVRRKSSVSPPDFRALDPLEAAMRMRAGVKPSPVAHEQVAVEDHVLDGPGGALKVRAYIPASADPVGICLSFHGGGWVLGDLDTDHRRAHDLAWQSGCVVLSVDYRLSPEARYPAALEDGYRAALWAMDNAARMNADPSRMAVSGASSGGNIAAGLALLARDRGEIDLAYQLLIYPVLDHRLTLPSVAANSHYSMSADQLKWFWDQYLEKPEDGAEPYASPLLADDLAGLPKSHVITAGCDPLCDEGAAYVARLRAAGVDATLHCYAGMPHGYLASAPEHVASQQTRQECASLLADALENSAQPGAGLGDRTTA